jgi:hypothetical protein
MEADDPSIKAPYFLDGEESIKTAATVAVLGGLFHAAAVFGIATRAAGVTFTNDNLLLLAIAIGRPMMGMFFLGAVPLFFLGRMSLVTPSVVTVWYLVTSVYEGWVIATPETAMVEHLLGWAPVLGLALLAGLVEFWLRLGLTSRIEQFELRPLW